jgi:hypothetical protein
VRIGEETPIPAALPIPEYRALPTVDESMVVRPARRFETIIRSLRAVGSITDETDTDEIWDEVFRGIREGR